MLSTIVNNIGFVKMYKQTNTRNITRTTLLMEIAGRPKDFTGHLHRVNNFEKKVLVWTGKYKNIEEVPPNIAPAVMEKARSRMRIRTANWMMALTLVGCGVMVYMGKQSYKAGDSLTKRNLEMHSKYNEEAMNKDQK